MQARCDRCDQMVDLDDPDDDENPGQLQATGVTAGGEVVGGLEALAPTHVPPLAVTFHVEAGYALAAGTPRTVSTVELLRM